MAIEDLLRIMAALRDPENGCPWDIEQTFETIAPYTIEEAYEVADAIQSGDMEALKDELGDLLLQSVYHAQMATEAGYFNFSDVVHAVCTKMISRHPHVFDDARAETAADVDTLWEERKAQENSDSGYKSALDGVALGLPALLRARKLQKRAARTGFEWPSPAAARAKLEEELAELDEAVTRGTRAEQLDELGDVLFCLVKYAAMLDIDAEESLRHANDKFIRRFKGMEKKLQEHDRSPSSLSPDEWTDLWRQQKEIS